MKKIINIMINLYNIKNKDFMGYSVNKNNKFTFHHIIKRENGGREEIKNGAILTENSHKYLHLIEMYDYNLYLYLSYILNDINKRGFIIERDYKAINYILNIFEKENEKTKNKKGLIIKPEYLKR